MDDEERRSMKKNKEHYDMLFHVADAEYGIPKHCPCGSWMVDEVATDEAVDYQPGKRFFTCKEYKNDGLHFRQPWVLGVQEEIERLTRRVQDSEKLIRECLLLREEVKRLSMQVADLERVL